MHRMQPSFVTYVPWVGFVSGEMWEGSKVGARVRHPCLQDRAVRKLLLGYRDGSCFSGASPGEEAGT